MNGIRTLSFICLLLLSPFIFSQKTNSAQIDTLLAQSSRLLESNIDSALRLTFKAAELSQQYADRVRLVKSYQKIAEYYHITDDVDMTISYAQKAMDASASINDQTLKANVILALGTAFIDKGYFEKAFIMLDKAKQISDSTDDIELKFHVSDALGFYYSIRNPINIDSAEYYYNITQKIAEQKNDSLMIAQSYINIATVYDRKEQWDDELVYMYKALDIFTKKKHLNGMLTATKNIGDAYYFKKENAKATEFYWQEYHISKELKSNIGIARGACDLAYMYAMEKKIELLEQYGQEAKKAAEQTKSWPIIKYVGQWMSEAYELVGNTKSALEYYKMYASAKDSINDSQRIEKSSRAAVQADFEAKAMRMKIEEEKQKAIATEKEENQKTIRNILMAGFILSIVLLLIAYRSYNEKKKANVLILKQKKEVEIQQQKIAGINKEMTDSIKYAQLIQRSILTDEKDILTIFPQSFGLYKPKSMVSGDFYWCAKKNNYAFMAAVDCTGHGVPGALMSMLGVEKLNEAIAVNLTHPSDILSYLNKGVKTTLRQQEKGSGSKDGMDIALCCFDLQKNILLFSGAQRPLWLIRNNELTEYESSKNSIGGNTSETHEFISHTIQIQKDDCIYIFTDGFADQFGGDKGKKVMTKNFKKYLLSIQNIPFFEQEHALDKKLKEWQGNFEQVDDILVIGIKV